MPTDSTEEALSSKRYATADEWSQFQNLIVQLYVDENKTLDEVKQYMEERHGFLATISMYKRQLASWNAYKNLRFDEVLQILRLKKKRDAENKPSVFFVRDRKVDTESLQVYISRNPALHTKLETGEVPHSDALRDVSCHSPAPKLNLPEEVGHVKNDLQAEIHTPIRPSFDNLVGVLRTHVAQNFESGMWHKSATHCWNAKGRNGPADLLKSLLDRCMTAALSVGRQVEPVAIRHALDPPFSLLIRVFRNPPPEMIPRILCVGARLALIGREDIQKILLQFCSDLANAIYGQAHPLSIFWKDLLHVPADQKASAIEVILEFCVSEFETRLGIGHSLFTEIYLLYFDAVERQKDLRLQAQNLQHQISRIHDQSIDPSILGMLKLEYALASCKLSLSEGLYDKAKEALTQLDDTHLSPRDDSFRCVWLGYAYWMSGDITAAENAYKDSIAAARRTESRDCVSEALYQLELFYLHSQNPLQAERIRSERLDCLRQLDSIIWSGSYNSSETHEPESHGKVTIIRIGSDASSATWTPRAFSLMAENHRLHSEIPSSV